MMTQGEAITATYYYNGECVITTKEFSENIIKDTIREFIISQHMHVFKVPPYKEVLTGYVNGFILFNLHKNKYMLKNKDELLKYISNNGISIEEKTYFTDIFLYNQRPNFLTFEEHEYIRACGNLDGFDEYVQEEKEEDDDYDNIGVLFNRLEKTVSVLSNKYSALIAE